MHPNGRNNDYRSYSYLPPSMSRSSRSSYYQYYDPRLRMRQSLHPNTTTTAAYGSSYIQPQRHRSLATITDLAEPMSVFDDLKFSRHRRSDLIPFPPPVYLPPNLSRQTSVSDTRLAVAGAARERLLDDIQHSITEIDREISTLELRSTASCYIPSRLSSMAAIRQASIEKMTPSSLDGSQMWPNKSRKIYNVIPRIASQPKKILPPTSSNSIAQTSSEIFLSRYHYPPEIQEIEIAENDPENADLQSVINEIPEVGADESLSLDQFRREKSALPQNRALIFVPEYVDNDENELTETADDFYQNETVDTDTARLSIVHSPKSFGTSNKLSIEDFTTLTRTAPKLEIVQPTMPKPDDISSKAEADLINTMLAKPVKHTRLPTRTEEILSPSQQATIETKNHTDVDVAYFFSDFGNEDEGDEDLISIDPLHFALPTGSDILIDDNASNILIGQFQTSLLNPHSSEQQQQPPSLVENNNEHVKETESKRIDVTTKDIITYTSTLPTENLFPISIYDDMQTPFPSGNNDVNEDQSQVSAIRFESKTNAQAPDNDENNHSMVDRQTLPINMNSLRHFSRNQSFNILAQDVPINTADIRRAVPQQTSTESRGNSPLPVPLNSPDLNEIRPSASRPMTPERRYSISSLDENILPPPMDILDFNYPSTNDFPSSSERDASSPLEKIVVSQEFHEPENARLPSTSPANIETNEFEQHPPRLPSISPRHFDVSDVILTSITPDEPSSPDHPNNPVENLTSNSLFLTEQDPDHQEAYPSITGSQRRSKLSLLVHRSNPNSDRRAVESRSRNNGKRLQRHVSFSNHVSPPHPEEINPLNNWRERVNYILAKKHSSHDKYTHIKSRVNSFANFDYQPRKFFIVPKRTPRSKRDAKERKEKYRSTQPKQLFPSVKDSTPQIFGRLWRLPNGRPKIFHETLEWNVPSKIKSYSLENFHYESHRHDSKSLNHKPRWYSESSAVELAKTTLRRPMPMQVVSLPLISDHDELNVQQSDRENEMKIFDVHSSGQQSISKFQESWLSSGSWTSKPSDKPIFNEKLLWIKKSKLKDVVWENIHYQPKKSTVQIFHQPIHWTRQSQVPISRTLTLEIQLPRSSALFSQHPNPNWDDIITANDYPLRPDFQFKDDVNENFNDQTSAESPANRPKWNSVSKTRSVNSVYNPRISDVNSIRRGWDLHLRRKRVHKLPPLKRKKFHDGISQPVIEVPLSNDPSVMDDNYDQSTIPHDRTASLDYAITPSRRSSRAFAPLLHLPDLPLLSESPRSQRPVQQEWYDELNKSRSTHRTEVGRTRNNSSQDSIASVHRINASKELRSSTRYSQSTVVSGTLLDSAIRTNRAAELRLSKDMEEYHQHSHAPNQSMPFEIRGFRLEGTQLSIPNHPTVRPLSNVNYRASERVKTRRLYPWSVSHSNGTSGRNSLLLPITELRHPSLAEAAQFVHEE